MKLAIVTSAFDENISELNYYTDLAKSSVVNWTNYGDIFVHSNNPSYFDSISKINVVESTKTVLTVGASKSLSLEERRNLNLNTLWSPHDKLEIVNHVFNLGYENCLFLDADEHLTNLSIEYLERFITTISTLENGLYFPRYWDNDDTTRTLDGVYHYPQWGYFKNFDFFHLLRDNLNFSFSDSSKPLQESIFFIKKFDKWNNFYSLINEKYRQVAMENDLKDFDWVDEWPYRPLGRIEGLSWIMALEELNLKSILFFNENLKLIEQNIYKHQHPRK